MGPIAKFIRLWHTVRHLRLRQIVYQVYYRVSGRLQSSNANSEEPSPLGTTPLKLPYFEPASIAPKTFLGGASFQFLHLVHDFGSVSDIDWNHAAKGKLWTYNLNYFEFLRQPEIDRVEAQLLIDDWIEKAATHRDGWEPYPISLRLVHWCCFYAGREVPVHVAASIRSQYAALQGKIEYHLGGNHLLENAIALNFTAACLGDEKGRRKYGRLLVAELKEQYYADGGHYELSPMYHCILLWRLLDLFALPRALCYFEVLKNCLPMQLSWLKNMVDAAGNYPHFNDSTDGVAPAAFDLLHYARKLQLENLELSLSDSGYRHWQNGIIDLWVDTAQIGPTYIPGHAHADNLTFCLSIRGKKIIVDTGISTYEKNEIRRRERGTAAHNTVVLKGRNSSDIWGGFRVGQRAKTSIITDNPDKLAAIHNGYKPIATKHSRTFSWLNNQLSITDQLAGSVENGTAFLHFGPDIELLIEENTVSFTGGRISFQGAREITTENYQKASGFNQRRGSQLLRIDFRTALHTIFFW